MADLVKIQEKEALTTSLKVAEIFGKSHRHVLRDIRDIIEKTKNLKDAPKFGLTSYIDKSNREQEGFTMNKNAFTLLVMGYTGEKAMEFKVAYINAFDTMETKIREMQKTNLTRDETALVFQLINFFRYLDHCKKIEEKHKNIYVKRDLANGKKYKDLASEFYVMRNNLLDIGNFKTLQEKYKQYYIKHPNHNYNPKMNKFSMMFTIDKYEPLRHAIADFLKLELQPDGYTLKLSTEAKDLAQRGKVDIEKSNTNNLFQDKEEDLINLDGLKNLASSLLRLN